MTSRSCLLLRSVPLYIRIHTYIHPPTQSSEESAVESPDDPSYQNLENSIFIDVQSISVKMLFKYKYMYLLYSIFNSHCQSVDRTESIMPLVRTREHYTKRQSK